jgi:hypothetical protein
LNGVGRNLVAVLEDFGMAIADLVKVTTFLTDRSQREKNAEVRGRYLGEDQTRADLAVCLRVDAAGLFVRSRGDRGEGLSALIFLSVLIFSQSVLAMRGHDELSRHGHG